MEVQILRKAACLCFHAPQSSLSLCRITLSFVNAPAMGSNFVFELYFSFFGFQFFFLPQQLRLLTIQDLR